MRDHLAAAIGDLARAAGELIGLLGVLGVLLHGRGDLLHRGRGLFQARRLLLGALRQVGRAGRDFGRRVGDLARRATIELDRLLQAADRGVEIVPDLLVGVGKPSSRLNGQVAIGQPLEAGCKQFEAREPAPRRLGALFGRLGLQFPLRPSVAAPLLRLRALASRGSSASRRAFSIAFSLRASTAPRCRRSRPCGRAPAAPDRNCPQPCSLIAPTIPTIGLRDPAADDKGSHTADDDRDQHDDADEQSLCCSSVALLIAISRSRTSLLLSVRSSVSFSIVVKLRAALVINIKRRAGIAVGHVDDAASPA